MKGVNFVTDEKGKRIALQIDLSYRKLSGREYVDFLENLEDVIDIELRRNEAAEPWESVKKEIE
ncbi:MAG: hypothetical protein HOD63_12925 [Bacteroidetes bacterium]|jgi:hypothetical protein|nr:hypothetical protein [Bacteroidota bacterium]MBT5528875.1 hypothetical protein [Cytophagia bacterium]MBT3801549.1 hypothetical protein [Bacteroidota bacterium]MBT3933989.1 hypothetical protein [Bacteroidota bacterium]MBT4339490.1 hypothetical protein [Bacteroidota bacterium]